MVVSKNEFIAFQQELNILLAAIDERLTKLEAAEAAAEKKSSKKT